MSRSLKEDNRPATMWFWDDWFSSFDVRTCSLAARGLWIDILGIMARAEIKGSLIIGGKQVDSKALAQLSGTTIAEVEPLLVELEENRVFSKLSDGTIINRRMFNESGRQEQISKIRSVAGKHGAEIRWQTDNKEKKDDSENGTSIFNSNSNSNSNKKESRDSSCLRNFEDTDIKLVQLLIDLIAENNPESSTIKRLTPKRQGEWINQCRLLREKDGRTPEQIEAIIKFSQADSFWKGNILSMPKLREKWDQLWMKAQKGDHLQGIRDFLNDK